MRSSDFGAAPLRILHLEGERPRVYAAGRHGLVEEPGPQQGWTQPDALAEHARRDPACRWLVLADYAEEEFWGDVMPPLRGAARKAWLARMHQRFAMESPFRWVSLQGASRSRPGKLRVLGYSLGNAERVMRRCCAGSRCPGAGPWCWSPRIPRACGNAWSSTAGPASRAWPCAATPPARAGCPRCARKPRA
jgi:hypothetical protein